MKEQKQQNTKHQIITTDRHRSTARIRPALAAVALLVFPLGASLLVAGEKPHQPQYRFIEIPVPGPSVADGINDFGLVTGFYSSDPSESDALSYLFEGGVLTKIVSPPGATYTSLGPPNNLGMVGGNYGNYTNQRPVFYDIRRGTYTPLPEIPGMPLNEGDGLNDFGHASGVAWAGGNWASGGSGLGLNWIWDGKKYNFFTVPGAVNGAVAYGINDWDQVAGYYVDSSALPKGFVKDGMNYITLEAPGALYTLGIGINNLGVVTGFYADADGVPHGYFWSQGQFVTVDAPIAGSIGTQWYGSNDEGDLAGVYYDTNFVGHAIIAERVDGDRDWDDAK